jgi:DNA-binding transcriptional regulator YiaG
MDILEFEALVHRVQAAINVRKALREAKNVGLEFPPPVEFTVVHTLRQLEEVYQENFSKFINYSVDDL